MAQKLLIARERTRADRVKDIAYVYDTLRLFAPSLAELRRQSHEAASDLPRETVRKVVRNARSLHANLTDDLRAAAVLLGAAGRSRTLDAGELRVALEMGLSVLFGRE